MSKLVMVYGFAIAVLVNAASAFALEPGQRAPQFSAAALSEEGTLSLSAYRGKIVYLDFWASWCPPCLVSLPLLDEMRKEFSKDHFEIIAINVDRDVKKAQAFLRDHPVGYPSARDPEGRLPEVFEIKTMPTSFLIDEDGVIRHVNHGFEKKDLTVLRGEIQKLLEADHD